jgi:hypothetical protein
MKNIKKISLNDIQGKLSNDQMKKVMAGSSCFGQSCMSSCSGSGGCQCIGGICK